MKVYLASGFSLLERIELLKEYLEHNGHEITVKWWLLDYKEALGDLADSEWYAMPDIKRIYERNLKGIDDADVVILVAPENETKKFNGANIEVGYALAKGKKVMCFGNIERSGMYWAVEKHTTIQGIVESLIRNAPSDEPIEKVCDSQDGATVEVEPKDEVRKCQSFEKCMTLNPEIVWGSGGCDEDCPYYNSGGGVTLNGGNP